MSHRAVRAVLQNSKATEGARLLLVVLAEHLNEQTRRCDPSVETLARECKTTTRSVQRRIRALVDLGELVITRGGGRCNCNSYVLPLAENPDAGVVVSKQETLTPPSPIRAETLTLETQNPDASVTRTGRNLNNSLDSGQTDFSTFWSAYPRKQAKSTAQREWNRAGATLPPIAELLAALEKHKASRQWQDRQFIPHPATWIRQARWEDDISATSNPNQSHAHNAHRNCSRAERIRGVGNPTGY